MVRATVIFGLVSAVLLFPVVGWLAQRWGWPLAFKLGLWLDLAIYTLLLVRWSGARLATVLFPLCILLGAAVWPWSQAGFFLLGLGILSWIRSGICFKAPLLRRITAETLTAAGGAVMVAAWGPASPLTWALGLWLFFLVQALYFFMMPGLADRSTLAQDCDPFETAAREALRILG
jgi:hypothetical protein